MVKENRKPRFAIRFLRWFCPPSLYEGIEGDILEQYEQDVEQAGEKVARRRLAWNVIRFFRPGIVLRNRLRSSVTDTTMLSNYFTIAWRNIRKNKVFSAINIFGLGTGLAACLLIFQFVSFELSYDKFNEKFNRIYRITNDRFQNGKLIQHGTIMYPTIGPTMKKDLGEVEEYTRMMPGGDMDIKVGDRIFRGDYFHFADEHFLSVFTYPLLAGQASTALKDPYSIVLTEETARKYFLVENNNYQDVVGKVAYWGFNAQPYTVTAVCRSVPSNSHLQFSALVSYATLIREAPDSDDSWVWSDMRHYLVLRPGTDHKALEAKFPEFSERYFQGDKVSGSVEKFYLQPLRDAHLYSDYEYDIAKRASGKAVWAMLIVAVFILLLAWINYVNLTTSRAIERAKEVGLRKVMGAFKGQLVRQFILESVLISFGAFVIAVILAVALQASFNQLIGDQLSLWRVIADADTFTIVVAAAVLVAGILLSGFYPAFVLSSYQPVAVLKGRFQRSASGNALRKGLVVFQFMASCALITSTLVVARQLEYMNDTDLGVNLQRTLVVQSPRRTAYDSTFASRVEGFKHALSQSPEVVSVATSGRLPGQRLGRTFEVRLKEEATERYTLSFFPVDHDFFDTYGIPLLAGRKFTAADHNPDYEKLSSIVVNRKATELLGFGNPEDIVGKQLTFWDNDWTVVGVVGDFHQEGMRSPMEPIYFFPVYSSGASISIRLRTAEYDSTIATIDKAYSTFFPDNVFEYFFIEDRYKNQYQDDKRFSKVIGVFTALAIVISCLGLIGLSSYTAVQRTKEVGIRKVMGASTYSIVSLLSKDFIRLVLVATTLALPVAWFAMQNWLSGYAYRITPGWLTFVVPVAVILLIAAMTISFQVLRAALSNPAETLKYE